MKNEIKSNLKSPKFNLVKKLNIIKHSIEKALVLSNGNLLVYFDGNIVIYDKIDFKIKYQNEIKNYRIITLAQLTNGNVACCLSFPPIHWGKRIIILDISNNSIEQTQIIKPVFQGHLINLLGSLISWELVLSEVGYCEFFELKNKKFVLKEKIEFKDNCFVFNFFEIEKDKIIFIGCYDSIQNFQADSFSLKNTILIYDISNNKKDLLFKMNPTNEFTLDKPIIVNNKYLVFIKTKSPQGLILFDIKYREFVSTFCSKNQNMITCIEKLSENQILVGDFGGFVTLYKIENNNIIELISKKLCEKIYEISKFNDNKFLFIDKIDKIGKNTSGINIYEVI